MKIEAGKYYKTRDGRKVGPMRHDFADIWDCKECFPDDGRYHWHEDGEAGKATWDCPDLIAEWTDAPDTPKLWRDMTPAEKGALLLAHHEGKVIEYYSHLYEGCWRVPIDNPAWNAASAYRVKPEPTVETVALYGGVRDTWAFDYCSASAPYQITFNLIDGKPDCASIRMEEL